MRCSREMARHKDYMRSVMLDPSIARGTNLEGELGLIIKGEVPIWGFMWTTLVCWNK